MALGVEDAEKLVATQRQAISEFFGLKVSFPPDRLFEVADKIRKEKLFKAEPFYLPKLHFSVGLQYQGLKAPLAPWFFEQIREGNIVKGSDWLPGRWVIFDISKVSDYKRYYGRQMYRDSVGLEAILAGLRDQGKIKVPDDCKDISRNSRFLISADEIDGEENGSVSKTVASILSLRSDELVRTPSYIAFSYITNLAHPEFCQTNTWEWFADKYKQDNRLYGVGFGPGLVAIDARPSNDRNRALGFRLQVSFLAKAA